jgi:hypothetical protein
VKALASLSVALVSVWCPTAVAQPAAEAPPFEQSLRQCGAVYDDFVWTHDIDGRVYIHVPAETEERIGDQRLHCVERWAIARGRRHLLLWPNGRDAGREVIIAKAIACGLDPARDLEWSVQANQSVRANLLDRGATFPQFLCLIEWADLTEAPVGFAASPPDSE